MLIGFLVGLVVGATLMGLWCWKEISWQRERIEEQRAEYNRLFMDWLKG